MTSKVSCGEYLKAAQYMMVDGLFNVNSTSVSAWYSLFSGIRGRKLVYRDDDGKLQKVWNPPDYVDDARIVISRLNTPITDQEMDDLEMGVKLDNELDAWSGVRYLNDNHLLKLAEECVKQVKLRGPFLNFSEFINRRLSDDELGTMGALQSAIDYDDDEPDPESINYLFKEDDMYMLYEDQLGNHDFKTPEAAVGSRFADIPGYVIQSDLLKSISNTLSVRDDTFRIRAYGEVNDAGGNVTERAWCEAIVQRLPEYYNSGSDPGYDGDDNSGSDPGYEAYVPMRKLDKDTGEFVDTELLMQESDLSGITLVVLMHNQRNLCDITSLRHLVLRTK